MITSARKTTKYCKKPGIRFGTQSGISYIEVIIVMVFISIALVTLLNSFTIGVTSSVNSEYLSVAAQLAEYEMEQIKSDKAAHGYNYLVSSNYPQISNPENFSGFTRSVYIIEYSDSKVIKVTVAQNDIEEVVLYSVFTNY